MTMKRLVAISAAVLVSMSAARAAHLYSEPGGWWDAQFAYDVNAPRYTGEELSLDLFGSFIAPEGHFNELFETNIRHGYWGGGAGLNYFFVRELALGVDFNMSAKPQGDLVDDVVGSLTLRLPIGNSGLAPYLIGSGGWAFNDVHTGAHVEQWVYGGGVGLEYRWSPTMGIFSDGRFFWGEKETYYNRLLIRAGLRVVL